jgi:hypothetical protein
LDVFEPQICASSTIPENYIISILPNNPNAREPNDTKLDSNWIKFSKAELCKTDEKSSHLRMANMMGY